MDPAQKKRPSRRWWYSLFLFQYLAVLWPPFYNRVGPSLLGVPFFYWYQLAWVIISALLTGLIYFVTVRR